MTRESPPAPGERVNMLTEAIRELRLCWRLLRDGRVPAWVKTVPIVALLYVLSPLDLIPDLPVLGINQLDDVAVLILGFRLFVALSPADLVAQLRREIRTGREATQTVDATYRVVDEGTKGDGQAGGEVARRGGPEPR